MQVTSHCLNQWWLDYRRIYASFSLNVKPKSRETSLVSNVASFWHFANSSAMILPTVLCVKLQNYSTTHGDVMGERKFGEIWIQDVFRVDILHCDSTQGPASISDKTSHRKISWSLEAARLEDWIIASLRNSTGTSTTLQAMSLSNFIAIKQFWI